MADAERKHGRGARRRCRALLAALAATTVVACTISEHDERALGARDAAVLAERLPIVHDSAIQAYITTLGERIASHTRRARLDWHFYVVNSDEVNAFSLPGGWVYVDRGVIERARRMDELAGVLGHEIGHVVDRHAVRELQAMQATQAGVAITCSLTRSCGHAITRLALTAGGTALLARYSRNDEEEADEEAVKNVVGAGIDPRGIVDLFEVLLRERQSRPTTVDAWFGTHPLEESRIADTRALIADIDTTTLDELQRDGPPYQEFRRRVAALPAPPPIEDVTPPVHAETLRVH